MIRTDFSTVPESSLILGADEYYSMDGRQTHCNNLVLLVGRSGAGKTRSFIVPNLLQCHGSYVVTDIKGRLYKDYKNYFKSKGYNVYHVNFRHPDKSEDCYNLFDFIETTNDIKKLSHLLTYFTDGISTSPSGGIKRSYDPYWDQSVEGIFTSIIGYMHFTPTIEKSQKNLEGLMELLNYCNREKGLMDNRSGDRNGSYMTLLMEKQQAQMEDIGEEFWPYKQFLKADATVDKTYQTSLGCAYAKLTTFDSAELLHMLSKNTIDFKSIGQKKSIIFVELSDTDHSCDILANLFFSQLTQQLCEYADEECKDGMLPVNVTFAMDDFGSQTVIADWDRVSSNARSRGISAIMAIQSEGQLRMAYGDGAQTIIDNCSNYVFLGSGNIETCTAISKRTNKPLSDILNMGLDTGWLFRTGQPPRKIDLIDLDAFKLQIGFNSKETIEEETINK